MKISASQLAVTPKKDYHPIENDFATWVKRGVRRAFSQNQTNKTLGVVKVEQTLIFPSTKLIHFCLGPE